MGGWRGTLGTYDLNPRLGGGTIPVENLMDTLRWETLFEGGSRLSKPGVIRQC